VDCQGINDFDATPSYDFTTEFDNISWYVPTASAI
jgi:hypothetical protein